jgi:hypothetical protein
MSVQRVRAAWQHCITAHSHPRSHAATHTHLAVEVGQALMQALQLRVRVDDGARVGQRHLKW